MNHADTLKTGLGAALCAATGTAAAFSVTATAARVAILVVAAAALAAWLLVAIRRKSGARVAAPEPSTAGCDFDRDRVELLSTRFEKLLSDYDTHQESFERRRRELSGAVRRRTAELLQRNHRLEQLDRLKDEFVSLLAHELRTPLTSVRSYVELLLNYGDDVDPRERQEFLGIICLQVKRLTRLINELLDLSRLRSGKFQFDPEPCGVDQVAHEVVEALREMANRADHVLVVGGIAEQLTAWCDRDRLAQILTNLVNNAIKYTPAGSRVVLEADPAAGGAVSITVTDNGPGVPPDERELIFEPFFRTREQGKADVEGTGLGLYLSRELARQMHGDLRSEPVAGGGARFRLSLPAQPVPRSQPAAGTSA